MKQTGLIGILGGLGPEAGRLLHGYIIEEAARFKAVSCDQDHYDVLHLSFPSIIPDRASYIFDTRAPNPTPIMFKILETMGLVAQQYGRSLSVCIPCNTYHAPILFHPLEHALLHSPFRERVQILNLIEESVLFIKAHSPQTTRVGLISTSGERASRIYEYYLSLHSLELVQVDEEDQKKVDDTIYNPVYGLKATSTGTPLVREKLQKIVKILQGKGVELVILGCTELPFVFDQEKEESVGFISPMRIMARRLIEEAEKDLFV